MKKMIHLFSLMFLALSSHHHFLIANTVSETSKYDAYRKVCAEAVANQNMFQTFKSNPSYRQVLEHVTWSQGREYLNFINAHYSHLIGKINQFRENDLLGSPTTYYYPKIGKTSPTTLRYVKVLGDLESYFGSLDQKKIIEIGGGYGGQCFIISKVYSFKEYQIVDLFEPNMLIQKYLGLSKVDNFHCIEPAEIQGNEQYDLVISNHGFSEYDRSFQNFYLENVFKNSQHGYLTMNPPLAGGITFDELVNALRSYGFNPKIFNEQPQTSSGSGPNQILIW